MSAPSLFDAALSDLASRQPGPTIDLHHPLQPVTADLVYALGLVVLAHCRQREARRSGRPSNSFDLNLLLHSAYVAELGTTRSKTAAKNAACRRLGSHVTRSKIEKATAAVGAELTRRFGSSEAPAAQALIARTLKHLDRVERRLEAERGTSAERRASDRHIRIARA